MTSTDTIARLAASAERAAQRSEWRCRRAVRQQERRDYLRAAAATLTQHDPRRHRWLIEADISNLRAVVLTALSEGEPVAARKMLPQLRNLRRLRVVA